MKDVFCDDDKGDEIEVEDFVEYDDVTLWRNTASSSSGKINNIFVGNGKMKVDNLENTVTISNTGASVTKLTPSGRNKEAGESIIVLKGVRF